MEFPYALGSILVRECRLQDADRLLEHAVDPPASCLRHLIRRQFDQARTTLSELAGRSDLIDREHDEVGYRQVSELAVVLGLSFVRQGDLRAAQGVWNLITTAGHQAARSEATAFLAVLCEDSGDAAGALAAWQRSDATAGRVWLRFGLACRDAGDVARARWALEKAADRGGEDNPVDKDAANAAHELAFLAHDQGDRPAALRAFALSSRCDHLDLAEQASEAVGNAFVLARELHESGEHEQAAAGLRCLADSGYRGTAVEKSEEYGKAREQNGELAAAAHYYRGITEFGGASSAAWAGVRLGNLLTELDRPDEAHEVLDHVGRSGVAGPADYADYARYQLLKDIDPEQANLLLRRIAEDPDHTMADQAKLHLGAELLSEDPDVALASFEDVARGGDLTAAFICAQTLEERGETERAAEFYRDVAESDNQWAAASALQLGLFAERAGDPDGARGWWLRAVDDERTGEISMMNLAVVAKRARDLTEARMWFRRVLESFPQRRAEAAAHLGEMCYWQGEKSRAVEWYRITLAESDEPELTGEAAYRTGEFFAETGETDAARDLLVRAIEFGFEPFASSASDLLRRLAAGAPPPS